MPGNAYKNRIDRITKFAHSISLHRHMKMRKNNPLLFIGCPTSDASRGDHQNNSADNH